MGSQLDIDSLVSHSYDTMTADDHVIHLRVADYKARQRARDFFAKAFGEPVSQYLPSALKGKSPSLFG